MLQDIRFFDVREDQVKWVQEGVEGVQEGVEWVQKGVERVQEGVEWRVKETCQFNFEVLKEPINLMMQ